MEKKTFSVDEIIESFCSSCNEVQKQLVGAVTDAGQISKLACQVCGTLSNYKGGVKKTPAKPRAKKVVEIDTQSAVPYDRTRKYDKGQVINHPTFGFGEIKAVVEPQKIDVMFGKTLRRLLHAQN